MNIVRSEEEIARLENWAAKASGGAAHPIRGKGII